MEEEAIQKTISDSLDKVGLSFQKIKTYSIVICVILVLLILFSSGLSILKAVYKYTLK
jgi:hypothetical protein